MILKSERNQHEFNLNCIIIYFKYIYIYMHIFNLKHNNFLIPNTIYVFKKINVFIRKIYDILINWLQCSK